MTWDAPNAGPWPRNENPLRHESINPKKSKIMKEKPLKAHKCPFPPCPRHVRCPAPIHLARLLKSTFQNFVSVALAGCLIQTLASFSAAMTVPGTVSTSWFGNSWVMDGAGAPKWANNAVTDIWVSPEGKVYTASEWDERAQEIGIYQYGDKIGHVKDTHGSIDGQAITGNASHLFLSLNSKFRRFSRSTNGSSGITVDVGGKVWGLAADANRLFVGTDALGGLIRVYNPWTQAFLNEWVFERPGRMSVDSAGNVWVIQRGNASNPVRLVHFSPAGTQLAVITFAAGVEPSDLAADGTTRVLVSDGGSNQDVKIYNTAALGGSPTTVSDTLGTSGGIFAAGGGYVRGQAGPGRFDEPTGVGIDSLGNYYVSTWGPLRADGAAAHNGSSIESYNSEKAQLWRVFGLEFEDCGDIDPTNSNVIYTKDGKYTVNWGNGVGQEATYWGTTLDHVNYPLDPRNWINKNGNNNAGTRVVTAGGRKFLYVWDQKSNYMQVYRFDGEVAVPAALFRKSGGSADTRISAPGSTDPWVMWLWQDRDQDGQFDADEYTTYKDNPYMFGWFVDRDGGVWKGLRKDGIRKFTLTVDANGMPTYSAATSTLVANPAPFNSSMSGDIRRVHYDAATDTMYVTGFNSSNIQGGSSGNDDRGAGRLMARYPNWNDGNRTASNTVELPYNFNFTDVWNSHWTPESIDVAGEYVFVAYFDPGAARIRVHKSSDLSFVGEITAGQVNGQIQGTDVDTPNAVNAFVRSNGEYIILQSNYNFANQLMFRWSPVVSPTGLVATGGNAQVNLSWSDSSGATSYTIKRSTTNGGPYADIVTQPGTSYINTGLINGTTYYYVVSAGNTGGTSMNSSQASATPVAPPAAPSGLVATGGNAQVDLNWSASTGPTSYTVKRSTTSGGPYTDIVTQAGTSYIDTGLTNGTTYHYVVSASNTAGSSLNSAQVSATPSSETDRSDEPGAIITARAGYPNEEPSKAFDNSINTKWLDPGGVPTVAAPSWIDFEFAGAGYAINKYTLTSANDEPARDPRSWRLKASNAATPNWSTANVLDTQTGQTFTSRFQLKAYLFSNATVYKKYRLEITENAGSSMTQISEIELREASATAQAIGLLSVASANITTPVNLTTIGTADWTKWGVSTNVAALNRKSNGGTQISNYTKIGTGSITRYTDSTVAYSWSDGTPTTTRSNNLTGIYSSTVGTGFSITVPADRTTRTLNLYVGGWNSTCELTAVLSDGSAANVAKTQVHPNLADVNTVHSITYNAAAASQSLTVTWKMTAGSGECTLQAAALMVGSDLVNRAIYEIETLVIPGKRLDVSGASTANGAAVHLWTDASSNNQRWMLEDLGTAGYELIPQHATGQRLDVHAASTADGARVQIWADGNSANQRWKFELQTDGSYEIIPQHALTKRLKANNGGTDNGTLIQSWADDNSSAVRWRLLKQ